MSTPQQNSDTRHFDLVIIGGGLCMAPRVSAHEK